MKKKIALILAAALLVSMLPLSAFGFERVTVTYNGKAISFPDAKPFIDDHSRTLVPLAPIASAMGLTYTWDGAKNTATFVREYTADTTPYTEKASETHAQDNYIGRETIAFTIGSREAVYTAYFFDVSDADKTAPLTYKTYTAKIPMDTAALLQNSRTYAPVKYLAENLGFKVYWTNSTQTADIVPVKGANALISVELLNGTGTSLNFAMFQGRLYKAAGVSSITFKNARLGTDNMYYKNLTQSEIASFAAVNSAPYITGAKLDQHFTSGKTATITIYFDVMYNTGLTIPQQYSFEYTYSGGPVYY